MNLFCLRVSSWSFVDEFLSRAIRSKNVHYAALVRRRSERKLGDCHFKRGAILAPHEIGAFHASFHRFKNAEGVVLVRAPRRNDRLLTDDAFAVDLLRFSVGMRNVPATAEQLHCVVSEVLDGNEIGKDELPCQHIRLCVKIQRMYDDSNV